MRITFYLDILFILSFFSAWITFWLTGKLIGKKITYMRMTIGAGVSSLLFLLSLFCPVLWNGWMGILFWIGVTVGTTSLVFGRKKMICNWFCSTTTMFLIGSIMMNLKSLNNIHSFSFLKWIVYFGLSVCLLIVFVKWVCKRNRNRTRICNIMICNGGVPQIIRGFVDSGNLLKDSITGRSVLLVQSRVVKNCVDAAMNKIIVLYETTGILDYNRLLECDNCKWGVHELSYQTVSALSERILCIYMDEIYVDERQFRRQPVAIVQDHLFDDKRYQAIVSEEML